MHKRILGKAKRLLAIVVTAALVAGNMTVYDVHAAEPTAVSEASQVEEESVVDESNSSTPKEESGENAQGTQENTVEEPKSDTDAGKLDTVEEESGKAEEKDTTEEATSESPVTEPPADEQPIAEPPEQLLEEELPVEVEEPELNYVYVESPSLETPDTQNILISFGGEDIQIDSAKLHYTNLETGAEGYLEADMSEENLLLFTRDYTSSEAGVYYLDFLTYLIGETEFTVNFSEQDMNISYGVDRQRTETDEEISEDDVDIDVVTIDENGSQTSADDIESAIDSASEKIPGSDTANTLQDNGIVVIVLDPGHDSTHNGAHANGLQEEDLTLKIAQYCKAELEQYSNVKVYMTRTGSSCPYPGTTSTKDNANRVEYAASVGADIFVSIHLNSSSSSTSAKGAEVYYPNSHYDSEVGSDGKNLASLVLSELAKIGLTSRGIKIRNSEDNTTYEDGSLADYYGVIRRCKLKGIPAIIVEHAFLTNSSDVNNFLSSDAGLKKLGVADAKGIAEYFKLGKSVTVTSNAPTVAGVDSVLGVAALQVTGVTPIDKIDHVGFAVWSQSNQSDLHWYNVTNNQTGNYTATLDIKNHKYSMGPYYIDTYAYDIYGVAHYLGSKTCTFTASKATIKVAADDIQSWYTVTAQNVTLPGGVSSVQFAVWSASGGQDDLKWYSGGKQSDGNWIVGFPISNHKTSGLYYADVYATNASGIKVNMGTATFKVSGITSGKVSIKNKTAEGFQAIISGMSTPSGVSSARVAVWSQSNQSDLKWYTATKQSDGSFLVQVKLSNHNYNYGTYNVHAYGTTGNGITDLIAASQTAITIPTATVSTSCDPNQIWYEVTAKNVGAAGGVKYVQFAVWSATGGQDDLKWYTGSKQSDGSWIAGFPLSAHKTSGTYYAHAYVTTVNGQTLAVGNTTFKVSGVSAGTVKISNKGSGSFDVSVSGMKAIAGISSVRIPVWSKADQSDIYWYTATKQSDGSYKAHVELKNHNYNFGTYYVHTYATTGNGIEGFAGAASVEMKQPTPKISVVGNAAQSWYAITASNVGVSGGLKSVRCAVWSAAGGQDDLRWYTGTAISDSAYTIGVQTALHKTAGKYYADVYAVNGSGASVYLGGTTFNVTAPSASSVSLVNVSEESGTFGIKVSGLAAPSGILQVRAAVWSTANQSDLIWYSATRNNDGTFEVLADIRNHGNNIGNYQIHVYATDYNGVSSCVGKTSCQIVNVSNVLYPIMGSTSTSLTQMVNYYNARATYPSFYASSDAPTIEAFCQMYLEECNAEGVKAEVAFVQAMKETGYLKFGGNVSITQYNFAGLGSTGAGVAGNSFASVRLGIRAQVQHLKAYASTEGLNYLCVDSRFNYVTRNSAPYVEWLGINENPYGKGWATAVNYGYSIVNMIKVLKNY